MPRNDAVVYSGIIGAIAGASIVGFVLLVSGGSSGPNDCQQAIIALDRRIYEQVVVNQEEPTFTQAEAAHYIECLLKEPVNGNNLR